MAPASVERQYEIGCPAQAKIVAGSAGETAIPRMSVAGTGSDICSHSLEGSECGAPLRTVVAVVDAHATQTSTSGATRSRILRRNQRDDEADGVQKNLLVTGGVRMVGLILPENANNTMTENDLGPLRAYNCSQTYLAG